MAMNNGRTGLSAGDSPLDARACADIGAELARVRVERGLTCAQVSETLLLSTRQVKALEEVEFAAFHNPTFHLNALRKYVAFAGLDASLVNRVASALARPDPVLSAGRSDEPAGDDARRGLVLVGSIVLLAAVVVAGGYFLWRRDVTGPRPQAAPARLEAPPPAVVPAADPAPTEPPPAPPAAGVPAAASSTAVGAVRVQHPTWIFVRDADNNVIEKTLVEGESFDFETQPTYLAVGTTAAELTISGRSIDVAPFVTNGQIRIRAGDFDALVQGASPIPAPTVAVVR